MKIELQEVGKRFGREWIFRNLNLKLGPEVRCAVKGANGSGKSTLIKILSGQLSSSKGKVLWTGEEGPVAPDRIYKQCSWAAPYLSPDSELSLVEAIEMQGRFMRWKGNLSTGSILRESGLQAHAGKRIRDFSSGMKQRVKLVLAFYADSSILLLDEPTTNLDAEAVEWYGQQLEKTAAGRIVVIASNLPREYSTCTQEVNMSDYC